MAELSYNDAYRAAHDATRDIRDTLNRILHYVDHIHNLQTQVTALQRSLDEIRRTEAALYAAMQTMPRSPQSTATTASHLGQQDLQQAQQLLQLTQKVDVRLQQIEAYLFEVSQYFHALREQQFGQQAPAVPKRSAKQQRQRRSG